jgi:hypothetical protein
MTATHVHWSDRKPDPWESRPCRCGDDTPDPPAAVNPHIAALHVILSLIEQGTVDRFLPQIRDACRARMSIPPAVRGCAPRSRLAAPPEGGTR